MADAILITRELSKTFAGFTALNALNLDIRRGGIHALIGPNGAGKTTVFNLLTGFDKPTTGRIEYDGVDITNGRPAEIANRGMVRSFQISAVFGHLSALENVRLGLQQRLGCSYQFWRSARPLDGLNDEAMKLLYAVGLADSAQTLAVALPYGRKRALEIATTLALKPELLLLDEPTQGMGIQDVARISALIREIAESRTVLMVEHNLNVVADLADRITVLNRGSILAEGDYATVSSDVEVRQAYMGHGHA